ncbi:MAG TPA: hypothetical protein VJ583_03705 [Nitrososphaeraceae archaeon]|jgi:hypothetical protein|nr:hypothetical protein [Nitrososphaeraceae archaeon]
MALTFDKLAFPGILVLLAVGTVGFLLAFTYYPEKHVNVDINGTCYELLDSSNEKHKILRAENEINVRQMQLNMIEYGDASLPVTFSGFKENVDAFIKQYNIRNIISTQKVSDNPTFDKFIIKATVSKNELQKIVNDLTLSDFYPTLSVKGSVGLGPNQYISSEERKTISTKSKEFMQNGIKNIVESSVGGVKLAECRNI